MTAGREAEKDLKALVSFVICSTSWLWVPATDDWINSQLWAFASSIYLLCPGEQSITPPLVFSKHHECLMAGNLLPTSSHPLNPYNCNTALIFSCFNTATSSSRPSEEYSCAVVQLAFQKEIHSVPKFMFWFSSLIIIIYNHHLHLGMYIFCGAWLKLFLLF